MSQNLELTFVLKSSQKKFQNLNKISSGMIVLVFFFINLAVVKAQDSTTTPLFSNNAVAKANQKFKENRKRKVSNLSFKENSSSDRISEAFTLDSVSDIVQDNFGETNFFTQYNTPFYLHYVNDFVHSNEIDEFINSSAAEKLFLYQTMSTAVNLLKTSALEPLYRQCVNNLQTLRNYTSVKFDQDGKGNLGVVSPGKTHEDPLFELKLHVSANNGIEPRLEVGKHLLFRYDVFNQNSLMEFRCNF